jgi:AcrR family transcriptional regulator
VRRVVVARTEQKIIGAADGLFRADGYHRTTLVAVADAAGVSERIVYVRFGTKAALLDRVIADATAAVEQHGGFRRAGRAPTLAERIDIFAAAVTPFLERTAPLTAVAVQAAWDEPLVATALRRRRRRATERVEQLWRGIVADELVMRWADPDWLVTTAALAATPETYLELAATRGFGPAEYETWLRHTWSDLASPAG